MIVLTGLTKILLKLNISNILILRINIVLMIISSAILYNFFFYTFPNTFSRISILIVVVAGVLISTKHIRNYLRIYELDKTKA